LGLVLAEVDPGTAGNVDYLSSRAVPQCSAGAIT